jgi:hypothetical protein
VHPLLDEARRVAPTAPQGQKRILAIAHPRASRPLAWCHLARG